MSRRRTLILCSQVLPRSVGFATGEEPPSPPRTLAPNGLQEAANIFG